MSDTLATKLAKKAKALRKVHGFSLDEAAVRIGVTKSHLWDFEQGRAVNPTLRMLQGLSDGYGIPLTQLLSDEKIDTARLHPFAMKIAVQIDRELKS